MTEEATKLTVEVRESWVKDALEKYEHDCSVGIPYGCIVASTPATCQCEYVNVAFSEAHPVMICKHCGKSKCSHEWEKILTECQDSYIESTVCSLCGKSK